MTNFKEQGSIVGFVMVGLALAALVIGGIYISRHQLGGIFGNGEPSLEEVVRQSEEKDKAESSKPQPEVASDDEVTEESEASVDEETTEANTETTQNESNQQSTDSTPADSSSVAVNTPATTSNNQTSGQTSGQTLAQTGVDTSSLEEGALPQTGAGDVLKTALPIATLVGAALAYRRSNLL